MKRVVLMVMVVLMLLLAGCQTNNDKTNKGKKTTPFVGGNVGLNIEFQRGSPPDEVYDGGDFPFEAVVRLENKGEYDVKKEKVRVKILGIRAEEFGVSQNDLIKSPDSDVLATVKDSEGNIRAGTPVFVQFSGLNRKEPLVGNNQFTFMAEVCYLYETTANVNVCIRENNIDERKSSGVCVVEGEKKVYNSGAPVQVISFSESARAKNKIAFTFDIIHKGTGKLYKPDSGCDNSQITNEDKVWVEVSSDAGGQLECSNLNSGTATSGYLSLYGDLGQVTCTIQKDAVNDFESPVVIKVKYDYKQSVSKNVLVKHQPENK